MDWAEAECKIIYLTARYKMSITVVSDDAWKKNTSKVHFYQIFKIISRNISI